MVSNTNPSLCPIVEMLEIPSAVDQLVSTDANVPADLLISFDKFESKFCLEEEMMTTNTQESI